MPKHLHFNVAGNPDGDEPVLVPDADAAFWITGVFAGDPINRWSVTIPPEITGGATVGYQKGSSRFRVIVPPGEGDWEAGQPPCLPPEYDGDAERVALIYRPSTVTLPLLTRDGVWWRSGGQRFSGRDRSAFALYERFLREGEAAIVPFLEQGQGLGYNLVRVFGMNTSVHHLLPWEWPTYYEDLPTFASVCARYGQYLNFVVFTQTQTLMPSPADQVAHLALVLTALHDVPCLVSKVNEQDQHDNRIAPETLAVQKPAGSVLQLSNGSNGADADTVLPALDWIEYHTNDLSEWQRKVGHNAMELADRYQRPCHASENTRADKDGFNTMHALDAAAGAALLTAGACCHTEEGKHAQPWAASLAWTTAWASGSQSVPLDYQPGRYNRLETDYLRTYQRILPDGRAWTVNIRA